MSISRMSVVGSASLRHASRTLVRTVLPLPPRAAATVSGLPCAVRAVPSPQQSANNGQKWAFPEGSAAAAAAAAVVAAVALVSLSSRREEGSAPVLAAGAYSIPIGRASPDVVSIFATAAQAGGWVGGWV